MKYKKYILILHDFISRRAKENKFPQLKDYYFIDETNEAKLHDFIKNDQYSVDECLGNFGSILKRVLEDRSLKEDLKKLDELEKKWNDDPLLQNQRKIIINDDLVYLAKTLIGEYYLEKFSKFNIKDFENFLKPLSLLNIPSLDIRLIGYVVKNRSENPGWWGESISEICLKEHQFPCWNNEEIKNQLIQIKIKDIMAVIRDVYKILHSNVDLSKGATYYFNIDEKNKMNDFLIGREITTETKQKIYVKDLNV